MKINYILAALSAALLSCASLQAQTPEEIVRTMSEKLDAGETEGFAMDLMMKMPILGEIRSHSLIRGNKSRTEIFSKDKPQVFWSDTDAGTEWTYDRAANEITISRLTAPKGEKDFNNSTDLSGFDNIDDGYDIILKEETADAWVFLCKKKKSNKDKDDPKQMDLSVAKGSYLPLYLRMKKSVVTISIENVTIGASEESVTFNPDEYPDAKIVDKR